VTVLKKSKSDAKLRKEVVDSLIHSAIKSGEINVKDKTEDEIKSEIHRILRIYSRPTTEFQIITDYRDDLLHEALKFSIADHPDLACLLYATWAEHWINSIISNLGKRKRLDEAEIHLLIRELSFAAKLTIVPIIFDVQRIKNSTSIT